MSEEPADDAAGDAGADAETDGVDDPFAEFDGADVDESELWAELGDGEAGEVDGDLFERLAEENPTQAVEPEVRMDGESAVVPKSKYCKRCEHFSEPPEVRCGHPGTSIAEVVDADRFRVENCPVVADRLGASDVLDVE